MVVGSRLGIQCLLLYQNTAIKELARRCWQLEEGRNVRAQLDHAGLDLVIAQVAAVPATKRIAAEDSAGRILAALSILVMVAVDAAASRMQLLKAPKLLPAVLRLLKEQPADCKRLTALAIRCLTVVLLANVARDMQWARLLTASGTVGLMVRLLAVRGLPPDRRSNRGSDTRSKWIEQEAASASELEQTTFAAANVVLDMLGLPAV
eukprot:SAG31_NODE_3779_length_3889_cov_3.666227_3_plen_207_part_00